mgnify:CR=1 FL=1
MEPKVIIPRANLVGLEQNSGGSGTSRQATTAFKYIPGEWTGENTSGILPIGDRVLVLVDKPEQRTLGGIEIPVETAARAGMAAETGVLVAVGESAFKWMNDRIHPWVGVAPKPGDRVILERYSGQLHVGADGEIYRLMEAKNLGAVITQSTGIEKETAQ